MAFLCRDGLVRGSGSLPRGPLCQDKLVKGARMCAQNTRVAFECNLAAGFKCEDGVCKGCGQLTPAGPSSANMGL